MLFNSFEFWIFFVLVISLYACLGHRNQNILLLVASYVFYGWWDYRFLVLILACTGINFWAAWRLSQANNQRTRKYYVLLASVISLGILGYFKYYNFFCEQANDLLNTFGYGSLIPVLGVILPVGISFYTFQAMSYTVDVYRGHTEPTRHFFDFALYVSFFPQLVAGPIERSNRLLPQVIEPRRLTGENFRVGLYHVMIGLFKKVVIADNLAVIANTIFNGSTNDLTGPECWIGVYAFAFQIYGDFSGYSSIAQGLAKWMGFDLMDNFRMPYLADSPSDFWRRWHISLSTWLRDYLYIPLGGNRCGTVHTYRNLMITMILGGLWHGAAWTFVVWGVFHGLLLCVYRLATSFGPGQKRTTTLSRALKIVVMFHLVCISWLLFRAESIEQAWMMFVRMLGSWEWTGFTTSALVMILFFAGPLLVYEYWLERRKDLLGLTHVGWYWRSLVYAYFVMMMIFFPPPVANAFIYFRF